MDFSMMSLKLKVEFINIKDKYPGNENLVCTYKYFNYKPETGDRIAIFKTGWESLKDYILFDWAAEIPDQNGHYIVTFNKSDLPKHPKDLEELYQFCYISQQNIIQGVSTPFQISLERKLPPPQTTKIIEDKDYEIYSLKEENKILKESLKQLTEYCRLTKVSNHQQELDELRRITETLKSTLLKHQNEINQIKEEQRRERLEFEQLVKEKEILERKVDILSRPHVDHKHLVKEIAEFTLDDLPNLPI